MVAHDIVHIRAIELPIQKKIRDCLDPICFMKTRFDL